jgi:cyclopropane fatty-acyl-phospholipid synthase-like methyltransferase
MASRVLITAERLQVFRKLSGKKLRVTTIGRQLGVHPRYLACFLDALVSLGLLQKNSDSYSNTPLAERHFVRERSVYWTRQFSTECTEDYEDFSLMEEVLRSGKDFWTIAKKKRESYTEAMKKDPNRARDFTHMLYYYHREEATQLARKLDLSGFRAVLDVGGGSGVMSMALVKKFKQLRACVLDIEPVCRTARQIIRKEGLSRRVKTQPGDMRRKLPSGHDVVMFCDIGHISEDLLQRAFVSLPARGMVLLVDSFQSEDRAEPLGKLLHQFIGSTFGVQTRRDVIDALRNVGFRKTKDRKIHQDVWAITGVKTKT